MPTERDAATLRTSLSEAVTVLRAGGIVAFPTETYYGLAVDALDAPALLRVQQLKGRVADKAIACIAADLAQVELLVGALGPRARQLATKFWPGPLTLVLPAGGGLPRLLAPEGFVGVRVSSHPIARALAQGLGRPITATSANLAGEPPVRAVGQLAPAIRAGVHVLDFGETPGGEPSTVVKVEDDGLTLLRVGAIPLEALCVS